MAGNTQELDVGVKNVVHACLREVLNSMTSIWFDILDEVHISTEC